MCGAAQFAMGRAGSRAVRRAGSGWLLLAGWNAGNAAVVAGTLAGLPLLVDAGGLLLLLVLLVLLIELLRRPADPLPRAAAVLRWLFAALLLVLIVSIPIGLVLAHLRA